MGRPAIEHCKRCGRHTETCGPLSARKLCLDCGAGRMVAWNDSLHEHRGPDFAYYRHRMLLAFGVETPNPREQVET